MTRARSRTNKVWAATSSAAGSLGHQACECALVVAIAHFGINQRDTQLGGCLAGFRQLQRRGGIGRWTQVANPVGGRHHLAQQLEALAGQRAVGCDHDTGHIATGARQTGDQPDGHRVEVAEHDDRPGGGHLARRPCSRSADSHDQIHPGGQELARQRASCSRLPLA
jgi:hypothetical protein